MISGYPKTDLDVRFLHFEVRGMAFIRDWYGQDGSVEMKAFTVKSLDEINDKINDGEFGAQEIVCAKLHIFAVYSPKDPLMFPGYTPLKLPIDTQYIYCKTGKRMDENEVFDEKVINFLDNTDTTSPMRLF